MLQDSLLWIAQCASVNCAAPIWRQIVIMVSRDSSIRGWAPPHFDFKHLLRGYRSQPEWRANRKQTGLRCFLCPVSARLLTASARFQLPPFLAVDWLTPFQGRGCRAAAAAKKPTWLTHVVYKGIHVRVGVRRWTSLLLLFVSNLCSLFNTHIFIFRYFFPGAVTGAFLFFFPLSFCVGCMVGGGSSYFWLDTDKKL